MIWAGMIQRCHNDKQKLYAFYGERGIGVADEWRGPGGFELFIAHIGPRPSKLYSVERKENDKGYEPGNVIWATDSDQARNTRRAIIVEIDGVRKPLKTWCEELGKPYQAIHLRIRRRGMDPATALLKPMRGAL